MINEDGQEIIEEIGKASNFILIAVFEVQKIKTPQ